MKSGRNSEKSLLDQEIRKTEGMKPNSKSNGEGFCPNQLQSEKKSKPSCSSAFQKQSRFGVNLRQIMVYCLAMISLMQSVATVQAVDHMEIVEHVLYENLSQGPRSFSYYKLVVGQRYYTGKEQLVIKAMADAYDSDPDVFISKTNQEPHDSTDAEWYCERVGSETCVLHNGEFQVGDTLYIGVSCMETCSYKFRAWYTNIIELADSARTQMRFDSYTTQILKYYVPAEVKESTDHIVINIEPEDDYTHIEVFLSLDSNFYLIEEKPAYHINENGVAIKFGKKDFNWCVRCYVYAIVNIVDEQRYYLTSKAYIENSELTEKVGVLALVNPFQQECYSYFVLRTKEDVRFNINIFTGHADVYITTRDPPSDPTSSKILIRGAHGPSRSVILTSDDRQQFGYTTGSYLVCFYATTTFSAFLSVEEKELDKKYDYVDGQVQTQMFSQYGYSYGRYTNSDFSKSGLIYVYAEGHKDFQDSDDAPRIFYKICSQPNFDDCSLSESEAKGSGMTQITTIISKGVREGTIRHRPSQCPIFGCTYLISVTNPLNSYQFINQRVTAIFYNPGDIKLDKIYQNTVSMGSFITYEINPITNIDIQPYLSKLIIKLFSISGDADLFVSFVSANPDKDNNDYMSRRKTFIDQVTLVEEGDKTFLNRPIFFSIYGNALSQYKVEFEYEFSPTYDEKLSTAVQLTEGSSLYQRLETEEEQGFYKFSPWWDQIENRTVVFLADMVFNEVFFYSMWNSYPQHFLTSKHDQNNTIAIYGSDADYHFDGTYYIRLRPDFAIYDLLTDRHYIYNMYAFSMAPSANYNERQKGFETMNLGEEYTGYINRTRYQDYRFLQIDMDAVYTITLTRIPNQGKPIFYIKMMDNDEAWPGRYNNNHFKSVASVDKPNSVQTFTLNKDLRVSRAPLCASYFHSQLGNGKQVCYISIGVTCENDESFCAYKLKIEQEGVDSSYVQQAKVGLEFKYIPPGPIVAAEYTNGRVVKGQVKYYYFPVNYKEMGESMIILHKTQIYNTGTNGDTKLLMNIQNNTENSDIKHNYNQWVYPTDQYSGSESYTGKSNWPEIIEPCQERMTTECGDTLGCALIVGVVGMSDQVSSYRLKGFYGQNKLKLSTPANNTMISKTYNDHIIHYYWFTINDTVADSSNSFDYQVSVATQDGYNPDLFVSLMDGRFPTSQDYDLASLMKGSDSISISSDSPLWTQRGWNTSAGVVVVVGVKVINNEVPYTVLLTSSKTAPTSIQRINVGESIEITKSEISGTTRGYSKLFQLYNWQHKDAQLTVNFKEGDGNIMYQKTGQKYYANNIYTAIPATANNSFAFKYVNTAETQQLTIKGDSCYTCWYFIKIQIDNPKQTTFRFTVSHMDENVSGQYREIRADSPEQVFIRSGYFDKRKFLLDSMDNFILECTLANGAIEMYVGLDPVSISEMNGKYIWKTTSNGGYASIQVKTTDKNFHMATFYYIYTKSVSASDAIISITLKQQKLAEFIPNNHDYTFALTYAYYDSATLFQKHQYQSMQEQVKFHVFQVPGSTIGNQYFKVKIVIASLTEHFYPQIYLKKLESTSQPQELSSLQYPSINDYQMVFGENPFTQLQKNEFEYTFTNVSSSKWVYYSMAVYQQNWGLTDERKSEYQIRIEADIVSMCEAIVCVQSVSPVRSSKDSNCDHEGFLQTEPEQEAYLQKSAEENFQAQLDQSTQLFIQ